ncbi:MAG: NifU family protein, partial [Flavobacteriaceae bacterium]
ANKKLVDDIYEYKDISQSKKNSPVAYALYKKFDIKEVFISENYISITKNEKLIWEDSVMEIREFIRSFLEKNNLIVNSKNKNSTDKKSKASIDDKSLDDVSKKIISIIEEYVKPAVASDGGNILFESYKKEDKSVNVILQGACSGCPSSTFTLKNGIENMLKEMLPGKILKVNAVNG